MDNLKQCMFCECKDNLEKFDISGNMFCSLKHFQEFHKLRNTNNVSQSHTQLDIQKVLNINEQDNAFIKSLPENDDEKAMKIIEQRILLLKEFQQSYRQSELTLTKHVMKIRERQEAGKTERYRNAGCNSDLEIKEKKLSKIQKMITSYKKMNMSNELIMDTVLAVTGGKVSREEITKEMENL